MLFDDREEKWIENFAGIVQEYWEKTGKRPYQNILKVIISAGVTAMICFLIGVLMHLFLN